MGKLILLKLLLIGSLERKEALDLLLLMTMILWIKLYCKNTTPSMAIMQKLERHCLDKKCKKSKVPGVEEEETLDLEILVVAVAILDQDQEATLGGGLMDMEVDEDLEMAIMGMEEDLEETMVLEEVEEVGAMVGGADTELLLTMAEASQVIINKAFLASFSGVGSKMEGVLLQVTNEEVVNHRVFKK
ncbi:hypothetical protein ACRRTK_015548 [Alexandromys fortis]